MKALLITEAEDDLGLFRGIANCFLLYLYAAGFLCWISVGCELLKLHLP